MRQGSIHARLGRRVNINGNQILQSGYGYVMEYAGTMEDSGTTYKYFRAPIPTNAAKFEVNNGRDEKHSTVMKEIYPLGTRNTTSQDYTENRMVFTLSGTAESNNTLTIVSPTFTVTQTTGTTTITSQNSHRDYTVRQSDSSNDYLYIRDEAGWNISIADGKVKFYDGSGQLITGTGSDGNGTYTLIKTVAETGTDGKIWYKIEIPAGAESFNVFYHSSGSTVITPLYDIYPYGADGSEGNHTTTGNMYYKTVNGGTLSLLESVGETTIVTHPHEYTNPAYVSANTRDSSGGDYLYLVCDDRAKWTGMKVTFYKADGTAIEYGSTTEFTPQYLNHVAYEPISPVDGESTSIADAAGFWYKIAIPADAATFTVTGTDSSNSTTRTASGSIYKLRTTPTRYENVWTLGDMQYRLPATISGSTNTLLYPKFTENTEYTVELGGKTISSRVAPLVDESQVAGYTNVGTTPTYTPAVASPDPVLYETNLNNAVYTWEDESALDNSLKFDNSTAGWTISGDLTATFYNGDTSVQSIVMTPGSGGIYSVTCPDSAYTKVTFTSGSDSVTINTDNAKGKTVSKLTGSGTFTDGKVRFDNTSTQWANVYVHFWNGDTESGTWYEMTDSDSDNVFDYYVPSGSYDHVRFSSSQSSSDSFPKTLALGRENGGKNACFTPLFDSNNIYFRVGSTPWGNGSGKIYAYYYNSASDQYANWGVLGGDNGCPEYKRDDDKRIHFDITSVNAKKAYSKLIVYRYNNGTTEWQTVDIDVSGTPKNGGGRIYQIRNDQNSGSYKVDFIGYGSSPESSGTWSTSGSYVSWTITGTEGDPTQYYSYQPEDRYGMISNDNSTSDPVTKGTADINDYIYITVPDSITKPYVLFYSDTS